MPIANSTFLDAFGAGLYTAEQYQTIAADGPDAQSTLTAFFDYGSTPATAMGADEYALLNDLPLPTITIGLVLDRINDVPNDLLTGTWASRQATLASLDDSNALWSTYGGNQSDFDQVSTAAAAYGSAPTGYVSSAADRTVWVTLDADDFENLFGQELFVISNPNGATLAWTGSLSLPPEMDGLVTGLWLETAVSITNPLLADATPVDLQPGPLGLGNGAYSANSVPATPMAIAANYNFPLSAGTPTGAIALVEAPFGNADLFAAYNQYRVTIGLPTVTQSQFVVASNAAANGVISEIALDISVVAGAAPNSTQVLYSTLGGTPFTAYQQAFFAGTPVPVLSSSYPVIGQSTASSPFQWAWQQLLVDGMLANVSVHMAAGDEGASANIPNGGTNVYTSHSSPFTMLVGGTSITGAYNAAADPTLTTTSDLLALALADDPATVFQLVAAGLKTLPSNLQAQAPGPEGYATVISTLFETVWQTLSVSNDYRVQFGSHQTGSGGIALTTDIPDYQLDFGLTAMTQGLRGMPDVAALASGNTWYAALSNAYVDGTSDEVLHWVGGTSAAAPLWASLTAQFNVVFNDQGLYNLGYYNDLLYIAAVIAPGSFNDIQLGDNVNSYYLSDGTSPYYDTTLDAYIVPTGMGYSALPGYDLASGLGTPNGLLLARALTAIAHSQVSYSSSPALLDDDGSGGWQSGAEQALLFQTTSPGAGSAVGVDLGGSTSTFMSGASAGLAWTSRLAQQSLQADFDPGLVLLFDKQTQGALSYVQAADNESLSLTINGSAGQAMQAALSNPFGFADFFADGDAVRVARPVAIAQTVGGQDDQVAVLRMRQGGENNLQVTVYKVDDLSGTIDGVAPGHAGYATLAQSRAYHTDDGLTGIVGPGYGQYKQVLLTGIDAGDVIAMRLDNLTTGFSYWAFAGANKDGVGHIWNYGYNTWGFEDTYGGGDRDYNDLVAWFDFTSAYGNGYLIS